MTNSKFNLNSISKFANYCKENKDIILQLTLNLDLRDIGYFKFGNKIHIKKSNKGKFTDYCGGKVTSECIRRGKNSKDPKIRKRAIFAANARTWKH